MSQVKFLHIRRIDNRGNIDARGGTTVAYRELPDHIQWATARCSPEDAYVKAYGRDKAAGRLNSQAHVRHFPSNADAFRQFLFNQEA